MLNLNVSFNFCARFGFAVIWFVKCMKIRKLKIEIMQVTTSVAFMQVLRWYVLLLVC